MSLFRSRTTPGNRPAHPDKAGLAATLGPAALEVTPRHVVVGDHYAASFVVAGWPAEVGPAWLDPLLSFPGRVDVAVHIDPIPPQVASASLRRQRARFESSRRLDAAKGRLGDPGVEAAADDAADLAARLARGAANLFKVGVYVTVHARTAEELADVCAQVRAAAASVLLDLQPATWRHHLGWATTLPLGVDQLDMRRTLDTDALAACFPLASHDLPAPLPGESSSAGGVLYGINTDGAGVVFWDRWSLDNHNSVVLARSGAGKSYFVKYEVLQNLLAGVKVAIVDPEDEYSPLADHVGGAVVRLGQHGVRLNPLDLPAGDRRPDTLTRRGLFLHTLIAVMLGATPPPAEKAALDRAIIATYAGAGITTDPQTWTRPAPRLADLATTLAADQDPAAATLAARLATWTRGSYSDLFAGPTTSRPAGHLVVWSLRHLSDELRTVGTLLVLDAIWREVDRPTPAPATGPGEGRPRQDRPAQPRRLVVVDEAWLLMRDGEGARFLYRMAKAARKRNAGLVVVTQDAADLLSTDLGLAVVSNSATQVLMRQSTQSIEAVSDAFGLTAGEARLLLAAGRGQGLLVAGTSRVGFRVVAPPQVDALCPSSAGADLDGLFGTEASDGQTDTDCRRAVRISTPVAPAAAAGASHRDMPAGELFAWVADRPWLAAVAVAVLVGWVAGRNLLGSWRHRRLVDGARLVTIAPPPQVEAAGAAALWTTLLGVLTPSTWRRRLYGIPHVGFECVWSGRALTIRLWVPGTIPPGAVEAAVHAAWPGAACVTSPATPPIPPGAATAATGGALIPALADTLPLGVDHDTDPLRPLIAAGAQVADREHACVQILARPATAHRARKARTGAARLRRSEGGDPFARAVGNLARAGIEPVLWVIGVFLPGREPRATTAATSRGTTAGRADPVRDRDARATLDKTHPGPLWEVAVRYAVATNPTSTAPARRGRRRRHRVDRRAADRLRGLAHTLASSFAAHTGHNRLHRLRLPHPVQTLAGRRLGRGFLLGVDELKWLAGLPTDLAVPGLDRARAKAAPAPVAVAAGGRGTRVLGRSEIGGHSVALSAADARHHVHLVGKTGTGKSTLLLNLILADVRAGRGAVVIDPRGDLIEDILERIPATMADRVVLIDPAQTNPASFNPLEGDDPHLAVDNLVSVFTKIFAKAWGPRMEDTLRVACLTLMQHANPTLAAVSSLLYDKQFRAQFTAELDDPEGLHGYWQWYDSMNDGLRAQVIGPVLARLRALLLRDFVKRVIGVPASTFDMGKVLDGQLLLCRLPKGVLGEDTTRVLGSLLVGRVWQAATARAARPEPTRKDASLYVDECQNFLNLPGSVADMLAEARGYRLSIVLAHQDLLQLPREIAAAASANARNKIFFTVDPKDAKDLAAHTLPELDDHDLAHLDRYTAATRLVVDGRETPAFTVKTHQPPQVVGEATAIRQACAAATPTPQPSPIETLARNLARRREHDKQQRHHQRRNRDAGGQRPAPRKGDGSNA